MKIQIISFSLACLTQCWSATWVPIRNAIFPVSGFPIVDQELIPINSSDLLLTVGTFDSAFAANLDTLDFFADDQIVLDAFRPTGSSIVANPVNIDGLFNTGIQDADPGNLLLGQDIYLMIQYLAAPTTQVLVFDLEGTFPEQDAVGNGAVPNGLVEPADVIFGGFPGVPVDTSNYPDPLSVVDLEQGIGFAIVPEPSTSLFIVLAVSGLMSGRRR